MCKECDNSIDSSLKFCPHCGSVIENIVETSEEMAAIQAPAHPPPAEKSIKEEDGGRNRQVIATAVGLLAIIVFYFLTSTDETYTLQYEVFASAGDEEFTLWYEYTTPDGDSEGNMHTVVPGCDEVLVCRYTFEIDFEYKEAFETIFEINCYGCDGDLPLICIQTFVDYYSIGLDCGFYSDPNDEWNFAIIIDHSYVNKQVIDAV